MCKTLQFIVEGWTENGLCEKFFKPYFISKNINFDFHLIKTKNPDNCDPAFRGGGITTLKLLENLGIVNNPNYIVSTFIDYYGYQKTEEEKDFTREQLENNLKNKINKDNFIPYIQQYEAETLLFCDPQITAKFLNGDEKEMQNILKDKKGNPEDINDGKETAPSKRIKKIFKQYRKGNLDFANIVCEIGIEKIKSSCPHFKSWLNEIENKF
ncbi:MAG: DUF4276 family protein [Rickettsiales bacterium]|nr:MAG: DUF4276 family protein [Rickettsiales bacterium]